MGEGGAPACFSGRNARATQEQLAALWMAHSSRELHELRFSLAILPVIVVPMILVVAIIVAVAMRMIAQALHKRHDTTALQRIRDKLGHIAVVQLLACFGRQLLGLSQHVLNLAVAEY